MFAFVTSVFDLPVSDDKNPSKAEADAQEIFNIDLSSRKQFREVTLVKILCFASYLLIIITIRIFSAAFFYPTCMAIVNM